MQQAAKERKLKRRPGAWAIYLFTALLAAGMLRIALSEYLSQPPFSFQLETSYGTEQLDFWTSGWAERYVFLPSFANLDKVRLESRKTRDFAGVRLARGDHCGELDLDTSYPMAGGNVTFMQSKNLPAMFIDTASGSLEYLHQNKEHREGGEMRLYDPEGQLLYQGGLTMKGRGNSTFLYQEKKPYSLTLHAPADLLGMGAAENWVLLANAFDPSHLRNKIVYDFAPQVGLLYSPECQWVDLYLNGEYAGLYLLSERNEIHPQRVDIPLEGSFLVSIDRSWTTTDQTVTTEGGVILRIHQSDLSPSEVLEIWQKVENAIQYGYDPESGKTLEELIDMDSWARKYLIEEVFGNVDGGRFSQFFYFDGSDPSGKIFAGPVWDYDRVLSNPAVRPTNYRDDLSKQYNRLYACTAPDSIYSSLYQNPQFREQIEHLYQYVFFPRLNELIPRIGSYAVHIKSSSQMDMTRWNTENPTIQSKEIEACLLARKDLFAQAWIDRKDMHLLQIQYEDEIFFYLMPPSDN